MIKRFSFGLVLFCLFLMSCGKDEDVNTGFDEFIFGDFYGECIGNCSNIFKMDSSSIFPDNVDYFTTRENLSFDSEALGSEKYETAEDALNAFPDQLWNDTTEVFGQPDAADQGGYFVSKTINGETRSWIIDTNINDIPEYLEPFVIVLRATIDDLK